MVAVMGYVSIFGMIAAGLVLIGGAMLVMLFSRAGEGAFLCMFSGTVFTALGGVLLVQQLCRTYNDLQLKLQTASENEVRTI